MQVDYPEAWVAFGWRSQDVGIECYQFPDPDYAPTYPSLLGTQSRLLKIHLCHFRVVITSVQTEASFTIIITQYYPSENIGGFLFDLFLIYPLILMKKILISSPYGKL